MTGTVIKYKDIPGFDGYRVGTDGSVWTRWTSKGCIKGICRPDGAWQQLKPDLSGRGRPRFTLRKSRGKYRKFFGSQLVLITFIGPCPSGMECCHYDGDDTNNHLSNLRWDTRVANAADKRRHGSHVEGESHPKAKLTEKQVRRIRREGGPLKKHARRYGVTPTLISYILQGKIWKGIK